MITAISSLVTEDDLDGFCLLEDCICGGWSRQMLKDAMLTGSSEFLKATLENKLIGYINFSIVFDGAEINSVAVLSDYRRMGIAKMMMEKLFEKCNLRGVKCVFLEVNENNLSAIELYKKCGFDFISERKNYYGKESALIYRKKLCEFIEKN